MNRTIKNILFLILTITIIAIPVLSMADDTDLYYGFDSGTEGFSSNSSYIRLTISNSNGTLKCVSKLVSGSTGWITKNYSTPIDGAYYDKIKIVAKAENLVDNTDIQGDKHRFKIYFKGKNKISQESYAEAESRRAMVYFKNTTKNSDGTYSNSDFEEYIIDMSEISCWSSSNITSLRIDPVNMSEGTLYIDSITLYNSDTRIDSDSINQKDFDGDTTFFDNRFCYIGASAHYLRTTFCPGNNVINATRLENYQSPDRTDYIYMKRNEASDCYFDVALTMPGFAHASSHKHKYLKVEGDLKADTLQEISFVIRDTKSVSGAKYDTLLKINADGTVTGGSSTSEKVISAKKPFHILWALDMTTHLADVYIDGTRVIAGMSVNASATQFNNFILSLTGSTLGDLYIDNFNVTGLSKPIVDGVETKSTVIPDDSNIIRFMQGKTGVHAYGNLVHKDGVKSALPTKGIYDEKTCQFYVDALSLNKIFGLSLSQNSNSVSGGGITVSKDGVATNGSNTVTLDYKPIVNDGKIFVPVTSFARDVLGKHVLFHKTGFFVFTDKESSLDTSDWIYQNMRDNSSSAGATLWNDIDYLNAYLQYERPSVEKLEKDYKSTTNDTGFSQHPRLFHTASEFSELKKKYDSKSDPVITQFINGCISNANYYINNPVTYQFSDSMRSPVGSLLTNVFRNFGYAYYVTGDIKYVNAAAHQFELAATFPDFNTAHVMDAGEAAKGLAIGYDWFYNAFNADQRKLALEVTREHCLDVLAGGLYGRLTSASGGASEWRSFKVMNNYNAIVNAGVTLASIATLEYDTETALRYIKDSARSVEYTMQMFPPGGGWNEGLGYCTLTMQSLVPMMSNLEKNFGSSYNLMDGQGARNILNYMIASLGTNGSNNMGDNGSDSAYSLESFFYFAKRFGNSQASYMRWNDLHNRGISPTFLDIAYYDYDAQNTDNTVFDTTDKMHYIQGLEMYSIRDTYIKEDSDTYFSTHFGTTTGYHQHWDCGSFVLDLLGQRWAYDLGSDNYNLQNEQGIQGYEMFRKRAEAHNMLVINPTQFTDRVEINIDNGEFAPVIEAKSNEHGGYVYADMSKVYPDASKMLLGYYIDDNTNSVTMRNEFTLDKDSNCIWTMNTKGVIKIDKNVAYIKRGGRTIRLEAICSGTNVLWSDNGNPKSVVISDEKFKNQNQNTEYTQLRLSFDANAGDHRLVIKISPNYGTIGDIEDIPISQWTLPDGEDILVTEIDGKITATTICPEGVLVFAGYDESGNLLDVEYNNINNSKKTSLLGTFSSTKAMVVDNFTNMKPACQSVDYVPGAGRNDITNSYIMDFSEDTEGVTVKNNGSNTLSLSVENDALKCEYDYVSGERCYMYVPLPNIDGEHYNKMKIKAKLSGVTGYDNASDYTFRMYYTGVDKVTGDNYGESSARGMRINYVNLEKVDGAFSNSEYEEYILDLTSSPQWTDSYISRFRFDGLIDASGTLYIDEIVLYHEDSPILKDFSKDMADITVKNWNSNVLTISLSDGNLKCDYSYLGGERSYMLLPLPNIDGEYYNRIRIKSKAENLSGNASGTYGYHIYFTGTDKFNDEVYGGSSARAITKNYTGLSKNSDGTYSNADYQEYVINTEKLSMWPNSYISEIRLDGLYNASGTIYIDEIEFYHEETLLSSIDAKPDKITVPLSEQNNVLSYVKSQITGVVATYSNGTTQDVTDYIVTQNGNLATVSYEDKSDTIELIFEVKPYVTSIAVTPETLTVPLENQNDVLSFVRNSIKEVKATYNNGNVVSVTDYTVSVSENLATVTYDGISKEISLTFEEPPMTEPVVFDFTDGFDGITAKNYESNVLTLSLEGGALKCDYNYVSGERSYIYIPLENIDGEHYDTMKIRAKIASVGTSSQTLRLFYTAKDKETGASYTESSGRGRSVAYKNLTEKNGIYSNEDYVDYFIDMSTITSWSDSYISKIRMDGMANASGVLYIDSIEFYHKEIVSLNAGLSSLTIPLSEQNDVVSYIKENIASVDAVYNDGRTQAVTDYTVSVSGTVATISYENVFCTIALEFQKEPQPVSFDFENGLGGIYASSTSGITIKAEDGKLKGNLTAYEKYIYIPLNGDGNYYNTLKARIKVTSATDTDKASAKNAFFGIFYEGTNKTSGEKVNFAGGSKQKNVYITDMTVSDGVYSNKDFVEYVVDFKAVTGWTDTNITRLRVDPIKNLYGTFEIESLEFYHTN